MTDIIVTPEPFTITTYLTYFEITTVSQIVLLVTEPIRGGFSINDSSITLGTGITIQLFESLGSYLSILELAHIVITRSLSFISPPSIGSNSRTSSPYDTAQIIDIRKSSKLAVDSSLAAYSNTNNSLDSLTTSQKNDFSKEVISTISNRHSAMSVIRSSVNRYRK